MELPSQSTRSQSPIPPWDCIKGCRRMKIPTTQIQNQNQTRIEAAALTFPWWSHEYRSSFLVDPRRTRLYSRQMLSQLVSHRLRGVLWLKPQVKADTLRSEWEQTYFEPSPFLEEKEDEGEHNQHERKLVLRGAGGWEPITMLLPYWEEKTEPSQSVSRGTNEYEPILKLLPFPDEEDGLMCNHT